VVSKIIDNKYKIGQKFWIAHWDFFQKKHRPTTLWIEYISSQYADNGKHCIYAETIQSDCHGEYTKWYKETDLFQTKAEAQSRCDELNKEASR
jgi:hypothetical protein